LRTAAARHLTVLKEGENMSSKSDRLANQYEVSKAVKTILNESTEREAEILATLLAKMKHIPTIEKRRAIDKGPVCPR
jgi:hypothetical protein